METKHSQPVSALLLAAGFGARLKPFSDHWPKCLMPIRGKALLEIWLDQLRVVNVAKTLVNLHYHHEQVRSFLNRPRFQSWVQSVWEQELQGTAGTLRANRAFLNTPTVFVAHADNLSLTSLGNFFHYHQHERPPGTAMTMMTFRTDFPKSCGIVELDEVGVVQSFHEKPANPPSNLANAAIYLLESEVLDWIAAHPEVADFSTQVIPAFMGRIATWETDGIMRDIGTPESLVAAQSEVKELPNWKTDPDDWQKTFDKNPIHREIEDFRRLIQFGMSKSGIAVLD